MGSTYVYGSNPPLPPRFLYIYWLYSLLLIRTITPVIFIFLSIIKCPDCKRIIALVLRHNISAKESIKSSFILIFTLKRSAHPMLKIYLGVCIQSTNLPKPTRINPTHRVGSVFRGWWVGLWKYFNSGSGWMQVITITNPLNPTQPTYIFM